MNISTNSSPNIVCTSVNTNMATVRNFEVTEDKFYIAEKCTRRDQ
jgi:hypothetical protein